MNTRAIVRSGITLDLSAPDAHDITPGDIAGQLAALNRWCGAPHIPFSVAQHTVIVALEMERHGDALAGLCGLLHDAHEAYMGDITEPTAAALQKEAPQVAIALARLKTRLDVAIHSAFNLDWPLPANIALLLDVVHARVALTEMRDIVPGREREIERKAEAGILPLSKRIVPHPSHLKAEAEWRRQFERLSALAGLRIRYR